MTTFRAPCHEARHRVLRAGFALGLAVAAGMAGAADVNSLKGGPQVLGLNFQQPVTEIAQQEMTLHNGMLVVCTIIFLVVFGFMFYSIVKHRKSVGHKAANFHESVGVEIAWTVVPFVIVICMGAAATRTVVAMKDTTNADLTIKATGFQWKWGYDYVKGEGEGLSFVSTLDMKQRELSDEGHPAGDDYLLKVDNPLVVPIDKKIRIITTANDVIHAWMVPAFGVKQDAIPGFVRDTWFRATVAGDYYGQCAELCGKEHAFMPIHVVVMTQPDYTAWVDQQKKAIAAKQDDPKKVWDIAALEARGEKVYLANCAVCHLPTGKGGGSVKALDGSPVVNDADKLAQVLVVLHGRKTATGEMPAWQGHLSETEIAAAVTYTKNAWSNHTGQLVEPADVVAAESK